ncbi:MAG: hypothetical protein AAGA37_15595 [Actinomycetota bacterium]
MTSPAAPADFDPETQAAFDRKLAAMHERDRDECASRQMWHAHHWPDEYDRCVTIGDRHVCRRCLTLYPAAIVVGFSFVAGVSLWPASFDPWLIWALCLPATMDFVLEQTKVVTYSARRQVVTTALLAPALGRGFGYELNHTWSWEFWGPVLMFCTIWFAAALIGRHRTPSLEATHG